MKDRNWQDAVTLILGLWLIASPWVLTLAPPDGVATTALTWNFVLSGIAAALLGLAALAYFRPWEEWLDIVLGLWLIASPWLLGFTWSDAFVANALICGLGIGGMGLWTALAAGRAGTV